MPDNEIEKKESKGLVITKVIVNVLFYIILIFIFICSIANIRSGSKVDEMPNVFGRGYLTVLTDSMTGDYDNSFNSGDMVVVNVINKNKQEVANKLELGDIITFYDSVNLAGQKKQLNSHRVVMIKDTDKDGNIDTIVTMGDKAAKQRGYTSTTAFNEKFGDVYESTSTQEVKQEYFNLEGNGTIQILDVDDIRGTYVKTIKNGGNISNTISQWGLLIVVLPLVIFLLVQVFFFIKNLKDYKSAKYEETHKDEIEAKKQAEKDQLKEELRAQLLAEMKAEEENKKKDEETSSNTDDSKDE